MQERDLPDDYTHYPEWSVNEIKSEVADETNAGVLEFLLSYEENHKDRKTAKQAIIRRLKQLDKEPKKPEKESDKKQDSDRAPAEPPEELNDDTEESSEADSPDQNTIESDPDESGNNIESVAEQTPPEDVEAIEWETPRGKKHVKIKNPSSRGAHIGNYSFAPGEVKEVVVNDYVRKLIRRGYVQVVSPG